MRNLLLILTITLCGGCTSMHEEQIAALVSGMTTEQKLLQTVMLVARPQASKGIQDQTDSLIRQGLGGLILMETTLNTIIPYLNHTQELATIPLIVGIDGEYGPGMRIADYKPFPRMQELGTWDDPQRVYDVGHTIGKLCNDAHIYINFAPVCDVHTNPLNPVISERSFGSNPTLVAQYASAYMRGIQDAGVFGCAKHFPGHGDTDTDSHLALPVVNHKWPRLDSVELVPFRQLIHDGVALVMIGHLFVPTIDSVNITSQSPKVVQLLRDDMHFDGVIVTDALGMRGVVKDNDYVTANVLAYKAGVDMLLMPHEVARTIDTLARFVNGSPDRIADLDARVTRILRLKAKKGMLEKGYNRYVDLAVLKASISPTMLVEDPTQKAGNNIEGVEDF